MGARLRPFRRCDSPRRQAGQRPDRSRERPRDAYRLRHRARRRWARGGWAGRDRRDAAVREPRAGRRHRGRRAQRPLLSRRHCVLCAHRAATVRVGHGHGTSRQACVRGAAAGRDRPAVAAAEARRGRGSLSGQGSREPIRDRRSVGDGDRGCARHSHAGCAARPRIPARPRTNGTRGRASLLRVRVPRRLRPHTLRANRRPTQSLGRGERGASPSHHASRPTRRVRLR